MSTTSTRLIIYHLMVYDQSVIIIPTGKTAGAPTSMIVDADCIQFELGGDKKVIVGGDFTFLWGGIASSTLGG